MKKLHVAFLWHMHQPLYKDFLEQRYYLPWVRLHSLKGYYDMPCLVERFPAMKVTFNVTPCLLLQLLDYTTNDEIHDDFIFVTKKRADELTREDKEFLLANFFMNNWDTIIKPHPRYGELLRKRGTHYQGQEIETIIGRFDQQDWLDLQVLFNLSWFGYAFRKKKGELNALIKKQRGYSEEEKMRVLDLQREALSEIIPLYKRLQEQGQIEVTTSPYYHPILPILNSGVSYYGFAWEEDVQYHVHKAVALYEQSFGTRPRGFWPSEGSVARSILYPFVQQGVQWLATDEDILMQTVGGGNRAELIYKPYVIKCGGGELAFIFRDKKLSDLIGFSYANSRPDHAARDFMNHIYAIRDAVTGFQGDHVVAIILDGENAWEYYRDGGEGFLSRVYKKIAEDPSLEAVTMAEYLKRFPPSDELHNLYAGSWINHNFDIWYGHHEDRVAWDYVERTRNFLKGRALAESLKTSAWEELYAAEGSDWFWWFGEEFSSHSDMTFDFLFRNHLMNVYRLCEEPIPDYLQVPIKSRPVVTTKQEPMAFINPVLDGQLTTFYEWAAAGVYSLDDPMGTMHTAEKTIETIYYGFNLTTLFFRLDLSRNTSLQRLQELEGCLDLVTDDDMYRLVFALKKDAAPRLEQMTDAGWQPVAGFNGAMAFDRILELSCPFEHLCVKPKDRIQFSFSVIQDEISLEKWPKFGFIAFEVPDEFFEDSIWCV